MKILITSLLLTSVAASAGDAAFDAGIFNHTGRSSGQVSYNSSNISVESSGNSSAGMLLKMNIEQQTEVFDYAISKNEAALSPETMDSLEIIGKSQYPNLTSYEVARELVIEALKKEQ